MRKLNLDKCKTNEEVCEAVSKRINSISFEELLQKVSKEFVNQEKAVRAIYTGLSMNMNVFLSGPGGYGKSTLIKSILKIYGIPCHTIVGYKDMPVDALLGIPNMQKLLTDSTYEINFKDCIFGKKGVLIGEEFTDILPSTAAALKDVLTEKGFRHGDFKEESFISTMIIAANKSSNEIVDDASKKALYDDRFPLKVEVTWDSYKAEDYMELLEMKYPNEEPKLLYFMAKLFEINHSSYNNTITPRKALDITSVYVRKGISFITNFDLNLDSVVAIKTQADIEFHKDKKESIIDSIVEQVDSYRPNSIEYLLNIMYALVTLERIPLDENIIESIDDAKKDLHLRLDRVHPTLTVSVKEMKKLFILLS